MSTRGHYWRDRYRGINFEVVKWIYQKSEGYRSDAIWNYYLFLNDRDLTEDSFNKIWLEGKPYKIIESSPFRYMYDYSALECGEFHGGITFYEKQIVADCNIKCVKIGCDYNHIWDEECYYSEHEVIADAKNSIDKLLEILELKPEGQQV